MSYLEKVAILLFKTPTEVIMILRKPPCGKFLDPGEASLAWGLQSSAFG